ncbi:MAG: M20 family metallopeptidase [Candidatus Latescibacterota bacterium]|nr:M20 family metallopeptidase [Candidatus Latescibacterota bacterium]
MTNVEDLIQNHMADLICLRHEIHQNPELGYQEHGTAKRVVAALDGIEGLDIRTGVAETGVVVTLGADKPGPMVALRADMDALAIQETSGLPYASATDGKMHACGHDGHTTCLVGAVRVLSAIRDELAGPVRFVFQPAEEGGGGGGRMCDEGVLDGVKAIFGLHGWPYLPQGELGVRSGPFLASSDRFRIVVDGQGAHAAFPHQGVDPIPIAAQIVLGLQTIASRQTDPLDAVVVTVAQIHGGTADNIIPAQIELRGTLRSLQAGTRRSAMDQIERIATQIAAAHQARAQVTITEGTPVLANDRIAAGFGQQVAPTASLTPVDIDPVMGGEDFAFYAERIPAAFFALGVRPPDRDSYPALHQPDYDFPDAAIATGVALHVQLARRFWSDAADELNG